MKTLAPQFKYRWEAVAPCSKFTQLHNWCFPKLSNDSASVWLGIPHSSTEEDVYEGYYYIPNEPADNSWYVKRGFHRIHPALKPEKYLSSTDNFDSNVPDQATMAFGFGRRYFRYFELRKVNIPYLYLLWDVAELMEWKHICALGIT